MGSCLRLLAAFKRYLPLHALHRCFFTSQEYTHTHTQMHTVQVIDPQYSSLVYFIRHKCCMLHVCFCLYVQYLQIHLDLIQRLESAVSEVAIAYVCGPAQLKCVFVRGQESTCSFTPRVSMWTCWSAVKFQTWR